MLVKVSTNAPWAPGVIDARWRSISREPLPRGGSALMPVTLMCLLRASEAQLCLPHPQGDRLQSVQGQGFLNTGDGVPKILWALWSLGVVFQDWSPDHDPCIPEQFLRMDQASCPGTGGLGGTCDSVPCCPVARRHLKRVLMDASCLLWELLKCLSGAWRARGGKWLPVQ